MSAHADIVQSDEHCRPCKGQGGGYDESASGGLVFIPCTYCRGTRLQTVRIDPVASCDR